MGVNAILVKDQSYKREVVEIMKDEIIQKALDLFAKEGYENTSAQKIVSELGITKPTLYHYFGNKEGLLRSLLDEYTQSFFRELNQHTQYNQDIIYTMEQLVVFYIHYAKNHPIYYRLSRNLRYSPLESQSYHIVSDYFKKEFEVINHLFQRIALHHTGLTDKSKEITYTFLGHIDGYITYHIEENTLNEITDHECRRLSKQFLYGIFSL